MTPDEYPDNLDDLLDRFVVGECTRAETEIVTQWLATDPVPPARQERLERFRLLSAVSRRPAEGGYETWDVDRAWHRAAASMSPAKVLVLAPREPERRRTAAWTSAAGRWAAAVALVVGSAAAIWTAVSTRHTTDANTRSATAGREHVTARSERLVLTLTDGTRVVLGPASKLILPPDYGRAGSRLVTLEGEGYFDVIHDDARPFTVRAGRGLIRDIGTKFVVRAYTPDQPVAVAVTEGEVLLADARLRQGDLGSLDTTGTVQVRRNIDLRSYTSWIEGRLVFDNTPLAEAIPVLERWYDLNITVTDPTLYDRRLFATLDNEPVSRVLELVALSLDLQVQHQGRTITLSRQRR